MNNLQLIFFSDTDNLFIPLEALNIQIRNLFEHFNIIAIPWKPSLPKNVRLYIQTLMTAEPVELMNISVEEFNEKTLEKPGDTYLKNFYYYTSFGFMLYLYSSSSNSSIPWYSYNFICEISDENTKISAKLSKS